MRDVFGCVRLNGCRCSESQVVRLHETYEDDAFVYMVMELCQGGELVTWIR